MGSRTRDLMAGGRSVHQVRSGSRSLSAGEHDSNEYHPAPSDFGPYISWACNIYYGIKERVDVRKILVEVPSKDKLKIATKSNLKTVTERDESRQIYFETTSVQVEDESSIRMDLFDGLRIIANYDKNDNLIQLDFPKKHKMIPQELLKILALIMQFYPLLQKITAKGVLHSYFNKELCNILDLSNVTSINLDDTYSHANDYSVILTTAGELKELSLARCSINDDDVKAISDEITYPQPGATSLNQLNLSGNLITSRGVQYIANALRSNRKLYYLNLSGNYITDEGVSTLFYALQEFPLTFEEDFSKKKRYIEHLKSVNKLRQDFAKRVQDDIMTRKLLEQSQSKGKSRSNVPKVQTRPGLRKRKDVGLDFSIMEPIAFDDPFRPEEIYIKANTTYCYGNNILCYLNLAYNDLTFLTVKKLLRLLKIQASVNRKPVGLVKVRLEGNLLPMTCQELVEVESIFNTQLKPLTHKGRRLI